MWFRKLFLQMSILVMLSVPGCAFAIENGNRLDGQWQLRATVAQGKGDSPLQIAEGVLSLRFSNDEIRVAVKGQEIKTRRFGLVPQATDNTFSLKVTDGTKEAGHSEPASEDPLDADLGLSDSDDILFDLSDIESDNVLWHDFPCALRNGRLFVALTNVNGLLPQRLSSGSDHDQYVLVFEKVTVESLDGKWQAVSFKRRDNETQGRAASPDEKGFVEFVSGKLLFSSHTGMTAIPTTFDAKENGLRLGHSGGPVVPVRINTSGQLELELYSLTNMPEQKDVVAVFERAPKGE